MPYGLDKKYFADNFVNNRIWYTAMFIYSYDEMNLCYFFFFFQLLVSSLLFPNSFIPYPYSAIYTI